MLAAAIAVALAYWGTPPCQPVVHVHQLDQASGVLGIAHPTLAGYCEVEIAARAWRWGTLCSVLVHEVGHLHGLKHSTDPQDVMYPELVRTADACRGRRPARYGPGAVIRLTVPATRSIP